MLKNTIPGGIFTSQFLRKYWQKKPLLIRQAFPNFEGFVNKNKLIALSCNEEAESRLVTNHRNQWQLEHGPFAKNDFNKLTGNWTLLVQGINYFLPEAQTLLQQFNFIPYTRLDDLMVSYAPDGGGVGPHFDSYDVFLLQGSGKRLWQISKQKDQSLLPDLPLRILKHFKPEQEWVLEPGDMLYLPPNYAHNGIAVGDSMTYSIGFRAPSHQELTREFLNYLQDHLVIAGMYTDPELKASADPARISKNTIDKISTTLKKIRFGKKDITDFIGKYLSEPKAQLFFDTPELPFKKKEFFKLAQKRGIKLNLKTQMLFTQNQLFINGEAIPLFSESKAILTKLANEREILFLAKMDIKTEEILYDWYLEGYLELK